MVDFFSRWLADPEVRQFITGVLGLLLLYIGLRLLRRTITRYVESPAERYRARKLLTVAGYILALMLLSIVFRQRLGGLTIFLGAAGAGVTLALREVILSVAGWLTITFGGLYSAGDRVQLAGIRGDVIDISILRTTLMEIGEWVHGDLYSGRVVRVANSFVYTQPVFNFSRDFAFLWDEIRIPVRHNSDHRLARETILRVVEDETRDFTASALEDWQYMLRRYRIEAAAIEPGVTMVVTDNWLEFTARYIVEYKKRRSTQDTLYTRILEEFLLSDGKVQVASATSEIVAMPDLSVKLEEKRQFGPEK